jgi:polyene glycosyltransferase
VEVEEIRPALMVVDSVSFFGAQVAITRGVPYALSVPFLPSNVFNTLLSRFPEPHSGLPRRMSAAQHLANAWFKIRKVGMFFTPTMWQVVKRIRVTCDELGIAREARSLSARAKRAELILSYSANGLDYPFSYPDKLHQVGAIVPPLPQAPDGNDLQRWLDTRYSVVYMAFGTITRLTAQNVRSLVDVARKLDGEHDVLWTLPREQQKFLPPPHQLPRNLRVVSAPPSQLDVLAHPSVKLFFTYSGGSGFHEALYFGKPLVVRPLWIDCYDLAVRGRDCGVSLTLDRPETFDVDDILDKLGRVLNQRSFRRSAWRFARAQQESGGTRRAAELILRTAATV